MSTMTGFEVFGEAAVVAEAVHRKALAEDIFVGGWTGSSEFHTQIPDSQDPPIPDPDTVNTVTVKCSLHDRIQVRLQLSKLSHCLVVEPDGSFSKPSDNWKALSATVFFHEDARAPDAKESWEMGPLELANLANSDSWGDTPETLSRGQYRSWIYVQRRRSSSEVRVIAREQLDCSDRDPTFVNIFEIPYDPFDTDSLRFAELYARAGELGLQMLKVGTDIASHQDMIDSMTAQP